MRAGGMASACGAFVYYVGMIDILTEYTAVKRAENFVKGVRCQREQQGARLERETHFHS